MATLQSSNTKTQELIAPSKSAVKAIKTMAPQIDQRLCLKLVGGVKAGNVDAQKALMEACLPLIERIARGCATRSITAEEFTAEGAIALLHAARSYNPASGAPFAAYAATWIRHAMRHAARSTRQTIRVPGRTQARLNRVWAAARLIESTTGRKATAMEIALVAKLSVAEAHAALERRGGAVVSIDQPRQGRESAPPVQGAVESAPPVEDRVMTSTWIRKMVQTIPQDEREIVIRRFGLDKGTPATLRDLSRTLKMPPRQIQNVLDRALRRLRGMVQA